MAVNHVLCSGTVKAPALRYDSQAKAEYRFTLEQREGDFTLWLPCFAPGAAGERLHEQLDEGASILITSGKLVYKKRSTKAGEVSRLEILVWAADVLTESPQVDAEVTTPAFWYVRGGDRRSWRRWHGACPQGEATATADTSLGS